MTLQLNAPKLLIADVPSLRFMFYVLLVIRAADYITLTI